jgi:hypothetical protein
MSTVAMPLSLPKIPDDVLVCAEQDGVAAQVIPILEMTRRLFPDAPMAIVFRPDPEDEDLHFLSVEVAVPNDADGDWRFAAQMGWVEETLKISSGGAFPFTLHLGQLSNE